MQQNGTSYTPNCIFCRIVAGELEASRVYEVFVIVLIMGLPLRLLMG